jgi:hypothetical protein
MKVSDSRFRLRDSARLPSHEDISSMAVYKRIVFLVLNILQCLLISNHLNLYLHMVNTMIGKMIVVAVALLTNATLYVFWRCLIRPRFSILRDLPQPPVSQSSLIPAIIYLTTALKVYKTANLYRQPAAY